MKVHRSTHDRMIAGVCGGLAAGLGWSAFRMRVVWVLATFFTAFAGVFVYLALWYLMPNASAPVEDTATQPWQPPG